MSQVGLLRNGGGSLSSDSTLLRSEKDPSWSVLYIFLFLLSSLFLNVVLPITCFAFALSSPARFDVGKCTILSGTVLSGFIIYYPVG